MTAERPVTLRVRGEGGLCALHPSDLNGGFSERREATFIGPADGDYRLLVDDEPLHPADGAANRWTWTPGFYAGEVRAELLDPAGRSLGVFRLDVSPDPNKAGREQFARMVEEIIDFDAHLIVGEEPARRRLGALGETDDPLVLFERLRKRRRDLERALAAIRREPVSVLKARRRFVPLREARRADLRTLRAAARQPPTLAAIRRTGSSAAASPGGEPILDVPAVERTLDAPANRCILHVVRALRLRCRALAAALEKLAKQPASETRTGMSGRVDRWREILGAMERAFAAAERRRPFSEVHRPEVTAAGLNAVAAHPLYARFWRLGWEALRRGVYRLDPQDLLPLSPTWEIYERWCFVALAKKLREWLPGFAWTNAGAADRRSATGRRRDGRRVTLRLQPAFANTNGRARDESWSVSGARRPDLAVTVESAGQVTRFVVLDAKYRAGKDAILSGMMESVHPYADALRWGSRRPDRTLLLVPDAGETEWLTGADYIDAHHAGVVPLRPDLELPGWFRALFTGDRRSQHRVIHARAVARIRLDRLRDNLAAVRAHLRPGTRVCFVVKADAYGHGAVRAAHAAAGAADLLAVSSTGEGRELREAGIRRPVLLLGPTVPEQAPEVVRWRLTAVCADAATARAIGGANRGGAPLPVHLELDTGMHRSGCPPAGADAVARAIAEVDGVRLAGLCTHFYAADAADPEPTRRQLAALLQAAEAARARHPRLLAHAANSAAVAALPASHLDLVRVGLAAYGYDPSCAAPLRGRLKPVMELTAPVTAMRRVRAGDHVSYGLRYRAARDTVVATIAAGYGDGYPWPGGCGGAAAEVRIGGRRYRLAGRVCMDHCMVDAGARPQVRIGDQATLFGAVGPTADEVAGWADTIPYEVLTRVAARAPRRYAWGPEPGPAEAGPPA